MRGFRKNTLTILISVTASAAVLCAHAATAASTRKATAKAVSLTPDQLTWGTNPGAPEVKTAALWGDPAKGPHGAFHKFPAGFTAPLHTHSADLRIVVISGTMSMAGEDGKETKLPAGSYFYQPHTYRHVTKCEAGSECVALVVANGKFDLKPVKTEKAGAKK